MASGSIMSRTSKERVNPFQNLKVERLMEFYQIARKDENHETRFPGVGLDNSHLFLAQKK